VVGGQNHYPPRFSQLGIFSLAFSDALHGIAVGGDYMKPDDPTGTIAITDDGGKSWSAGALPGYRSAVLCSVLCLATGTSGSNQSTDGGKSWGPVGGGGFNAMGGSFAVGSNGRVAILMPPPPR